MHYSMNDDGRRARQIVLDVLKGVEREAKREWGGASREGRRDLGEKEKGGLR